MRYQTIFVIGRPRQGLGLLSRSPRETIFGYHKSLGKVIA